MSAPPMLVEEEIVATTSPDSDANVVKQEFADEDENFEEDENLGPYDVIADDDYDEDDPFEDQEDEEGEEEEEIATDLKPCPER